MFEKKLKELNPNIKNIEYQVDDLYRYVDSFVSASSPSTSRSSLRTREALLVLSNAVADAPLVSSPNRIMASQSEIVALINHSGNSYEAYDSEWIKKRIYGHLRKQAG